MAPPRKNANKKATTAAAPATAAPTLNFALLKELTAATRGAQGFMYAPANDDLKALTEANYVEVRFDIKDEGGNVASRATTAGMEAADAYVEPAAAPAAPFGGAAPFGAAAPAQAPAVQQQPAFAPAAAPAAEVAPAATSFKVLTGLPIPAARRFGKATVYPFDSLGVGACFVVPADEQRPNPAKSLASTVTSANGRYATVDGAGNVTGHTRHFTLRNIADGKDYGYPGVKVAVVWRDK